MITTEYRELIAQHVGTEQRPVHEISASRAAEFLKNETSGRIFQAYSVKADGTMRKMVCRRGVRSHVTGGGLRYNPDDHGLLVVFELSKKQYRTFKIDRLVSFNISGETFIVDHR